MPFFEQPIEYQIRTGNLKIVFHYYNIATIIGQEYLLDCNIIKEFEISYGYEDVDDSLVFYPNLIKLSFEDISKDNYEYLRSSIVNYANSLPANKYQYSGVDVYLNGARKFRGHIDPLTLHYDGNNRTLDFEVVDSIIDLKNIAVDRHKHYIHWDLQNLNQEFGNNYVSTPFPFLWGMLKDIWPDFIFRILPFEYYQIPNFYGIFVKHDWVYNGTQLGGGSYDADWATVKGMYDTFMLYDSFNLFTETRPCQTCIDLIKVIARQLGVVIGFGDYGKVFFYKRFGINNFMPDDVTEYIIEYNRTLHLDPIRGVRCTNYVGNKKEVYDAGTVEVNNNGEILYIDKVIQLDTYNGTYHSGNETFTSIVTADSNNPIPQTYEVWHAYDPLLNIYARPWQLAAEWLFRNRKTAKDKIELKLDGINYDMCRYYKVMLPEKKGVPFHFRPMQMDVNFMKNTSKIIGLEI